MADLEDDRDVSIAKAYKIIASLTGMGAVYKERLLRSLGRLNDPGAVASELKKKIVSKGLKGESAAKYFFKAFMNAVNGE